MDDKASGGPEALGLLIVRVLCELGRLEVGPKMQLRTVNLLLKTLPPHQPVSDFELSQTEELHVLAYPMVHHLLLRRLHRVCLDVVRSLVSIRAAQWTGDELTQISSYAFNCLRNGDEKSVKVLSLFRDCPPLLDVVDWDRALPWIVDALQAGQGNAASFPKLVPGLQIPFVRELFRREDTTLGGKYLRQFRLYELLAEFEPDLQRASSEAEEAKSMLQSSSVVQETKGDSAVAHFHLPFPCEEVIFVNSADSAAAARAVIFEGDVGRDTKSILVGLDVEWRASHIPPITDSSASCSSLPSKKGYASVNRVDAVGRRACTRRCLLKPRENKCAILQLGTSTHAVIVDVLFALTDPAVAKLLVDVFTADTILLIGFGLKHDLQRLHQSYPWQPCFRRFVNTVDLQSTYHACCPQRSGNGLSALVVDYLGQPLDKSCQITDWERRPLTSEQVVYAALDAVCLVLLYRTLESALFDTVFEPISIQF